MYGFPYNWTAVNDSFGDSGKPLGLLKKYGPGPEDVVKAVEKVVARKN